MKMDWERKFNSILKDTEANLSRVKTKFTSGSNNVTWAPKIYSTPMKKSTSLLDIPMYSTPLTNYPQNGLQINGYPNGTDTFKQTFTPFPSTQVLQDKIEQQSLAIDHLTSIVHRLETDRHNYKEQIRDLRNEIFQLTEKASARHPDPSTERRVEGIRRELLGEIQLLQSQLQINSAKGNNAHMSDTQLMSMNRDILEIKHAYRDELENFRRDMEVIRSRIAKVELELASVLSERRQVERRQDHLDRTLNSLSLNQQKTQLPSSTVAIMNTNRQLEQLQISELRRTLDALKDKIDNVEQSQLYSSSTPLPTTSPKKTVFQQAPSIAKPSINDTLEDLDLSDNDSESSDFTEFELDANKKQTFNEDKDDNDIDDADELDIDDLDLSDDDDDNLSQLSLDEPLENAALS